MNVKQHESNQLFQKIAMAEHVNFNIETEDGWAPIHFFCRYFKHSNLIDFVRLLIDKGADAQAKTIKEWNPLHFLFRNIRELSDKGVDLIELASLLIEFVF